MRQLKITKLKKVRREPKDKEYEKVYFEAKEIYHSKRRENYNFRHFLRHHSSASLINLFSYARINRCYKELVEIANAVERKMDHENTFRSSTCRNTAESLAVHGTAEENTFVNTMREEAAANIQKIEQLKSLLAPKEG